MKIGIFGDAHGNIDALKAAYDEATAIHVDRMYHLGDLGGKLFINAGSAGKPKDSDPRACLTVIEKTPATVTVDFNRGAYITSKK